MNASALIRRARTTAGLTQVELARRAGMKQPEIARLESQRSNPRLSTIERVVAAAGHSLDIGLSPAAIDETLVAASLKESHAERLRKLQDLHQSARSLSGLALKSRGS